MTEYRISAIMRRDVQTLTPDIPIRRAVALLVEARAEAAAVTDAGGRLVGILTQKDCFRPALQASYYQEWKGQVADHMSRNVTTVSAQDDVIHVAEMFVNYPHRVFPVVEDGRIVGLLHRAAVLALLMRRG